MSTVVGAAHVDRHRAQVAAHVDQRAVRDIQNIVRVQMQILLEALLGRRRAAAAGRSAALALLGLIVYRRQRFVIQVFDALEFVRVDNADDQIRNAAEIDRHFADIGRLDLQAGRDAFGDNRRVGIAAVEPAP